MGDPIFRGLLAVSFSEGPANCSVPSGCQQFGWQLPRRLLVISRVYHSIDRGSSPSYPSIRAFIRVLTPIIRAPLVLPVPFRPCVFGCKRCKCLNTRKALPSESGSSPSTNEWCLYMSSDHNLGSLLYIGDYTIELY